MQWLLYKIFFKYANTDKFNNEIWNYKMLVIIFLNSSQS